MCQCCKSTFNVQERAASHSYFEQIRDLKGLPSRFLKSRKRKTTKKAFKSKINFYLSLCDFNANHDSRYIVPREKLANLENLPFDKKQSWNSLNEILREIYVIRGKKYINYVKTKVL